MKMRAGVFRSAFCLEQKAVGFRRVLGTTAVTILGATSAGCSGTATENEIEFGEVTAELTTVPTGVTCVRLTSSNGAITKLNTVSAGSGSSSASIGQLPIGETNIRAEAFGIACASVTGSTTPTWVSQEVAVDILPTETAAIRIVLVPAASTSVALDFVEPPTALEVGNETSYAITASGAVRAWGLNSTGLLGDGSTTNRLTPIPASALGTVSQMSAYGNHACLIESGDLKCWGANGFGQFGIATAVLANSTTPVTPSTPITNAKRVLVGADHTCVLLTTGSIQCAGRNGFNQLGNGGTANSSSFGNISGTDKFNQLFAGQNFTCGKTVNGAVKCWGQNTSGQLGNGTTTVQTTPVDIGLAGAEAVAAGDTHACVRLGDGSVWCWGNNAAGQLGDGTTVNRSSPVPVLGGLHFVQIAAGAAFSCGVVDNGDAYCWGRGQGNGLGHGVNVLAPQKLAGLANTIQISAGSNHACARLADGSVWCWGDGRNGALGNGGEAIEFVPVRVTY